MKIATTMGQPSWVIESLPYAEIMKWEMYFHDEAKIQSQDYYDAKSQSSKEVPLTEFFKVDTQTGE